MTTFLKLYNAKFWKTFEIWIKIFTFVHRVLLKLVAKLQEMISRLKNKRKNKNYSQNINDFNPVKQYL